MSITNHVSLLGHLGADPTIIETKKGTKVAKVNIATNEYFKDEDGNTKSNTEWHRLVAFGKVAERFENYLKKGSEIIVNGKIVTNSYTNKEGEKKYSTEINVQIIYMLDKANKAA